jgi:hypothetical protein
LLEIAKFLIESGANVNIPDAEGETPYTYALQIHRGKRSDLSDLFLKHMTDNNTGKGLKKKSVKRKKKSIKIKKKGKKGKNKTNKTNKK